MNLVADPPLIENCWEDETVHESGPNAIRVWALTLDNTRILVTRGYGGWMLRSSIPGLDGIALDTDDLEEGKRMALTAVHLRLCRMADDVFQALERHNNPPVPARARSRRR